MISPPPLPKRLFRVNSVRIFKFWGLKWIRGKNAKTTSRQDPGRGMSTSRDHGHNNFPFPVIPTNLPPSWSFETSCAPLTCYLFAKLSIAHLVFMGHRTAFIHTCILFFVFFLSILHSNKTIKFSQDKNVLKIQMN